MTEREEFKSKLKFQHSIKDTDMTIAVLGQIVSDCFTMGSTASGEEVRQYIWRKAYIDKELDLKTQRGVWERVEWLEKINKEKDDDKS